MISRRSFIKSTGLIAAGSAISAGSYSLTNGTFLKYPPLGLQVYTLSGLINAPGADTKTVLKQIADLGIKEIETATGSGGLYYKHSARDFAMMANDLGLKWIGNHVGGLPRNATVAPASRNLRDNLSQIIDEAAEGGCTWVICSSSSINNLDEIKRTTEIFIKAGDATAKNKMKFAYHNHQSEFTAIEGISAFDYVLGNTDKNKVFMELDLAWASAAGMDPVALFKKYPNRFPLWHVKDLDKTTGKPCPVGKGKIDFKHIFENSRLSGVKHAFIEQDGAKQIDDPAESVTWLNENIYKKT